MRIIQLGNTLALVRASKDDIKKFRESHVEVAPNRWIIRPDYYKTNSEIYSYIDHFTNPTYLIGKGPSLDLVTEEDFKERCTIVCVNDSIKKINTLNLPNNIIFSIQQDSRLTNTCLPRIGKVIASISAHAHYKVEERIIVNPLDFGCHSSTITAVLALKIFKALKIEHIILIGFDSLYSKNTDYANIIGYDPSGAGNPNRFLRFATLINSELKKFKTVEIIQDFNQPKFTETNEEVKEVKEVKEEVNEVKEEEVNEFKLNPPDLVLPDKKEIVVPRKKFLNFF